MQVACDISLYPLDPDFVPPIKNVIERLNRHAGLDISTNAMSTQIFGEYDAVMQRPAGGDRERRSSRCPTRYLQSGS